VDCSGCAGGVGVETTDCKKEASGDNISKYVDGKSVDVDAGADVDADAGVDCISNRIYVR